MNQSLEAYLHWQKERGLPYPAQKRAEPVEKLQEPEKIYRIVFYDLTEHSDNSLTRELLSKMLQAIQVKLDDVVVRKIATLDAIDRSVHSVSAVFCESGFLSPENEMIGMPHPADILANPLLKRNAWESLKKIAALLSVDS